MGKKKKKCTESITIRGGLREHAMHYYIYGDSITAAPPPPGM